MFKWIPYGVVWGSNEFHQVNWNTYCNTIQLGGWGSQDYQFSTKLYLQMAMMICSGDGFSLEHSDGKEIWNLLGCWCSDVAMVCVFRRTLGMDGLLLLDLIVLR